MKINWDLVGIGTSLVCAIHCAILPIIIGALPVFGTDIIQNHAFEWGMIALAIVVGCIALVHGYLKHHRINTPFYLFGTGAVFLVSKQFFHSYEYLFLGIAVTLIIVAHYLNFQYCHSSKACSSPHHKH